MMNIILFVSCLPVLPLIIYFLLNEVKFKKNIAIGVTIPSSQHENAEVVEVLKSYKKIMKFLVILLFLLGLPILVIKDSDVFIYFMVWLLFIVVVPNVVYAIHNTRLKQVKARNGWNSKKANTLTVDIKSINMDYRQVHIAAFVPAILIPLIFVFFDRDFYPVYIMFASLSVFYAFAYKYLYRNKSEMVDSNTKLTMVLTQIRRYSWKKIWLVNTYANVLFALAIFISKENMLASGITFATAILIIILYCYKIELSLRKKQEKWTQSLTDDFYVDDDDHWIWGLFYYNENDSKLIVNNRVGINSSVNIAKPFGKILTALVLVIILGMPFIGVYISAEIKAPIAINVKDQHLLVDRGSDSYDIKIDNISQIVLLDELPDNMRKINGLNADNVCSGEYSAKDYGNVEVCLDPEVKPYMLISTKSGEKYIFGTRKYEDTKRIYKIINEKIILRFSKN